MANSQNHKDRAHAKLSASGAERYFACPGSVALSEGLPDKSSAAAQEGTRCHEVLERIQRGMPYTDLKPTPEMVGHAKSAAQYISRIHERAGKHSPLLIEEKVSLSFIHPEMFGTLDSAVVEHFGTLDILDFKYGSHQVSPVENLQLLFYSLGVAHANDWNFKKVRLTVIQPRARGYDGPVFWEIGILKLKEYVGVFRKAVKRVSEEPDTYNEGGWCHFCKAKTICPLKREARLEKAKYAFSNSPLN